MAYNNTYLNFLRSKMNSLYKMLRYIILTDFFESLLMSVVLINMIVTLFTNTIFFPIIMIIWVMILGLYVKIIVLTTVYSIKSFILNHEYVCSYGIYIKYIIYIMCFLTIINVYHAAVNFTNIIIFIIICSFINHMFVFFVFIHAGGYDQTKFDKITILNKILFTLLKYFLTLVFIIIISLINTVTVAIAFNHTQ